MNKVFGAVYVVIGVFAIIGAIAFTYAMSELGSSLDPLVQQYTAVKDATGLDQFDVTTLVSEMRNYILIGWLWIITVLLSGIFSVWTGFKVLIRKEGARK